MWQPSGGARTELRREPTTIAVLPAFPFPTAGWDGGAGCHCCGARFWPLVIALAVLPLPKVVAISRQLLDVQWCWWPVVSALIVSIVFRGERGVCAAPQAKIGHRRRSTARVRIDVIELEATGFATALPRCIDIGAAFAVSLPNCSADRARNISPALALGAPRKKPINFDRLGDRIGLGVNSSAPARMLEPRRFP
jgi:hypothetical protein